MKSPKPSPAKRPVGRPPSGATRWQIRVPEDIASQVDDYRRKAPGIPDRTAVIIEGLRMLLKNK